MVASTRLTAWIGLAVTLCLVFQETSAATPVFMGRYNGQTRRDFIFNQIAEKYYGVSFLPSATGLPENVCPDDTNKKITVDYFPQPLDQFNSSNTATWQQHYQVNEKFFDSTAPSEVIFLLIGGEGAMSNQWVCFENYTYMKLASDNNALVIQLEHRFFGSNKGLPSFTPENLKFLNTKQALADLNEFIKGYNKKRQFKSPKWVVFGGSYPGTMAALFKRDYPNSVQGAISSSSVFGPKVDLYEYAQKMEEVLIETDKSYPKCYANVKAAFSQLQSNMLTDVGRGINKRALNLASDIGTNIDDILTVQFRVFDAFQGMFQYTYDGRADINHVGGPNTVSNLCKIMTDSTYDAQRIGALAKIYQVANNVNDAIDPSYQNLIKPWKIESLTDADGRNWLWLQCNQFGYLQSTTNLGVFGNAVPLTFLTKMCKDLFGIDTPTLYSNVRDALGYFGQPWEFGSNSATENVAFPIGGFDPWSMLATNVSDTTRHLVNHVTPGTAHCSDMYPHYAGEPAGLKDVRDFVANEVTYYLSLPSTWGNNGNTQTPGSTQAGNTGATQAGKTGATKASSAPKTTTPGSFAPSQSVCNFLLLVFSFALACLLRN